MYAATADGLWLPKAPRLHIPSWDDIRRFGDRLLFDGGWSPQRNPGQGSRAPIAIKTFKATNNDETDATSYSFASCDIGQAGPTRAIVVGVMSRVPSGNPAAPTTLTVGGTGLAKLVSKETAGDRNTASLWIGRITTGTSVTIALDFSGVTQQRCGIGWWVTYNLASMTAIATNSTDVSGAALDVSTKLGGLVFGFGDAGTTAATTFTWTGLTEDFDTAVGTGNGWMSGASALGTGGTLGITCTGSGTPTNDMYVSASLR